MSVAKNKEVTRLTIEEVMNKSNLALIPELFAENYVHRAAAGQETRGHEGWRQNVINAHAAFPDLHYTIDELVGEGDKVVCRATGTGTFKGEYMGVAPNGKRFSAGVMFVNTFEKGKIVETWAISNPLISLGQLGINPPGYVPSGEANKALVRRYFEEVMNKGNISLLDELMDENYVMRQPNGQEIRGRAGSKQYFSQMRSQFAPDIHVTIDEMVAEGDEVVVTGTWDGTQTGAFQGIPATGKSFKYVYSATYKVAGGKIASGRIVSDTMTLFQQLGVTPPAFTQTQEANKAVIRRTVEEIWNKGNVSLIPEQIAPDYVAHNAGAQDYRGQEGFRDMVTGMRAAFPDLHYGIDSLVCEGDKVVCNCTITGTNTGPMMGMPPTGKKMAVKHSYVSTLKDGKSVETWALADRLSIFQQLGITPPSTPTS